MSKTGIDYVDETWNIVSGCTAVDEGCRNCWAALQCATRLKHNQRYTGLAEYDGGGRGRWTAKIYTHKSLLMEPLSWHKARRVFVAPRGDLFHASIDFNFIRSVFAIMGYAENIKRGHTFMVFTKRAARMYEFFQWWKREYKLRAMTATSPWPWPHVQLFVSAHDQTSADARGHWLAQCPAYVRGLSLEPLLGTVDLRCFPLYLNQVIVGGESGKHARPMHPVWVSGIQEQCEEHSIAFYFKQWGEWANCYPPLLDRSKPAVLLYPDGHSISAWDSNVDQGYLAREQIKHSAAIMGRVGKKAAGKHFSGRLYQELAVPPSEPVMAESWSVDEE